MSAGQAPRVVGLREARPPGLPLPLPLTCVPFSLVLRTRQRGSCMCRRASGSGHDKLPGASPAVVSAYLPCDCPRAQAFFACDEDSPAGERITGSPPGPAGPRGGGG